MTEAAGLGPAAFCSPLAVIYRCEWDYPCPTLVASSSKPRSQEAIRRLVEIGLRAKEDEHQPGRTSD
jgi:hypothetical protein